MSNLAITLPQDDFEINGATDPVPDGLGNPGLYRIYVMPIRQKNEIKTASGVVIHLPDESVDAQNWLNSIGRIAAMGPCAFKHPRFKELGLTEEDTPKVGDLILYASRSPFRFKFKGASILVIHDDWYVGKVEEDQAAYFKFYV
jgi:hypothetical protein